MSSVRPTLGDATQGEAQAMALRAAELAEANARLEQEIAECRAAEESLRQAQEVLQLALRGANLALWSWNPQDNSNWANSRYWTHLGYEPGEVPPTHESWLSLVHPDDRERMIQASQRAMRRDAPAYPIEYRLRRKDGAYTWVYSVGDVTERDAQGNPLRFTGCHLDITARKELEERIGQREVELARIARAQTLGELASGLAHELNQPLAAIVTDSGTCESVLRAGNPESASHVDEGLRRIAGSARRATEIIRRLRRTVRKRPVRFARVDLAELARTSADLVAYRVRNDAVTVSIAAPRTLPPVEADPVGIEQVLVNLLQNAVDAVRDMPAGARRIELTIAQVGESIEVEVRDTGPGIDPERLDQVFEAFVSTKREGLGVGLAICRTIVTAHGGQISCENRPAGGAAFRFRLPAKPSGRATEPLDP